MAGGQFSAKEMIEQIFLFLLGPLAQEPHTLFYLIGIIFGGAFLASAFGVGSGVLMTPLVILLFPPKWGIGLLGPVMLLISGTGVRQYWREWDNRLILVLLPASLIGVWLGAHLLALIPAEGVKKAVGTLAIIFGMIQFFTINRPDWRNRLTPNTWQGVILGFAAGVTSALAHLGGIVFAFYLLPHSRTKEVFVGTTIFLFFISGLVKIGSYVYYDILNLPILLLSLSLIPAMLVGSIAGKKLNQRVSNRLFLQLICILVSLMGIRLILN